MARIFIVSAVVAGYLAFVLGLNEVKTFYDATSYLARENWTALDVGNKTAFLGYIDLLTKKYFIDNYGKNFTIEEFQRKVDNGEIGKAEIDMVLSKIEFSE